MSPRSNRRRHPRVEGEGITGHVKHEGEVQLALPIENISLGGMLLRCAESLPVGSQVFLEVAQPGTKSLKLVGRVLSVIPLKKLKGASGTHGVSIRFNPMGEDATQRLQELVTSLYLGRPSPVAAPSPVRVALSQPAPRRDSKPDFDFDFAARSPLAEGDMSEATTGKAAAAGAQFDAPPTHDDFDFSFGEPLAVSAQEPVTISLGGDPEAVEVPPSAKLTVQLQSKDATPEELRMMLEERDDELKRLHQELSRKNDQIEKLRRAVLELRHRNKPVL